MPRCVRYTDISSGHCFPPRPNVQASPNVWYNNLGAHRVTDAWATHCCGGACHAGNQAVGSPNVWVNNLQQARIGDAINCGDFCGTGSPNVYANGP